MIRPIHAFHDFIYDILNEFYIFTDKLENWWIYSYQGQMDVCITSQAVQTQLCVITGHCSYTVAHVLVLLSSDVNL